MNGAARGVSCFTQVISNRSLLLFLMINGLSVDTVDIFSSRGYFTNDRCIDPGGGGNSHMKQTGMLIVSLRGVNFGF